MSHLPLNSPSRDPRRVGYGFWTGIVVVLVVGAVILVIAVVPPAAVFFGSLVPQKWFDQLGDEMVSIVADGHRWCRSGDGIDALFKMVGPLYDAADPDYQLNVRVLDSGEINAFAAPGGKIVILRGVIDTAGSPEEVAGVLAHEMAHQVHRHPTEAVIRALGLLIILQAAISDSDHGLGVQIVNAAFSRNNELEADETAVGMLQSAGFGARGLTQFFERLVLYENTGELGRVPAFLSSHPPTKERLDAIEAAGAPSSAVRPALTAEEWKDLKAICDF